IGKTGRLHAELSKNLSLENSTFKRDHLLGGLPSDRSCRGKPPQCLESTGTLQASEGARYRRSTFP
ncbi:hypothetical protein, partial [Duganella sp. CF517]|uniref:hypothetical protein n=1 Tax=Duganella sp. CF517 TaxID=1881038 RepID=UPI001C42EEA1